MATTESNNIASSELSEEAKSLRGELYHAFTP